MKPIDRFSYLKNNRVSQDTSSLVQCYLPIIGQEALSLYLYTISFWDNGRKEYLFSSILNHLNFGMDRLLKSLKILSAFNLLTLYQKGDVYQLALHAPLSSQDFLEHPVYRRLLEKKIGDAAVEDLKVESAEGEEISVSLNQVFPDLAELGSQEDLSLKKKVANDFDLDHFRQLMARDGLRFADEQSDVLNLFAIAEEKKWTWFETYQLAKSTAVSQVISTKRMREKIAQKPVSSDFSPKEATIIKEAKSKTALQFLAEIKQTRKGTITQTERDLLQQIMEKIKLQIVSHTLEPNQQLPTVRELASEAGVNPNTIQRALSDLEREGFVYSKRTTGRFVTENKELIAQSRKQLSEEELEHFVSSMTHFGYEKEELPGVVGDYIKGV